MKKKLLTVALCAVMAAAMAVPAFAAINTNANNQYIYAWKGSGAASLTDHGSGNTVTVNRYGTGATRHGWSVVTAPHGNYRITHNGNDINIYRVSQGGYYLCTTYPYENATQGRDQRVDIITTGSYSRVRLSQPLIGGSWYMMPDRSAASSSSPVIWYTASTEMRAYWS